jgi:hypothetical protein
VKLVRSSKTKLFFHLGRREKRLLEQVLKLYPRVPSAHHVLSKSGRLPDREENQRLLDEALAEQRTENRRQLRTLLADPGRFEQTETGCRLWLARSEVEWCLQVLNDVRIGSWVILGSPEGPLQGLDDKTAPHLWAMEMAGHFQMQLLEALEAEAGSVR